MSANKKLVALAALTLVSGLAQAETQLKVYGYVEADFGSYKPVTDKATPSSTTTKLDSGNMMTSFIGFAGSEDLGGGLKAEFTLESFLAADTGAMLSNQAGQFWGRASWVALGGEFGRVLLGQYDNTLFTSGLVYNPFGSSMTFSPTMRQYYGLGSTSSSKTVNLVKVDTGWVNSITYETPTIAGVSGTLQYAPKESTKGADSSSYALGLAYNAGPLSLMANYTDAGANTGSSSATAAAYPAAFKASTLNGSYDFGVVKAFAQYSHFKYDSKFLQTVGNLTAVDKASSYQLGVSVPVTASGSLLASYGAAKYKEKGDDASDKILSLGYDQTISKRTSAFVAFTSEKLTDFTSGRAIAVGVKHNF